MQRAILRLAGFAVRSFYRHQHITGAVPSRGPVILVGNHPNGLVDPVVVSWVTDRTPRFLAKAPLFTMPVLGLFVRAVRAIPVHRPQDGADAAANERAFAAVHDALAAGDLICLFPEGVSHDEPALQRLKTGAARMALGAEARAGFRLGVRVVPVGLVYRAKHRFRSTVATWVGAPIAVADFAAEHARDPWVAVEALTAAIAAGLRSVTLELDRWEDLPLLELAERIDRGRADLLPEARLVRLRAFAAGLRRLRASEPERVEDLAHRADQFRERLRELGLGVADLDVTYTPGGVARFVARNLGWLLLGLPLALAGTIFHAVPYWTARLVGGRVRTTRDVYATVQILSGAVFFPLWTALAVVLVGLRWSWAWALVVGLLALPAGLAARAFHDWRERVLGDVGAFLRLGLGGGLRGHLRDERDRLAAELEELRALLAAAPTVAPPAG